MVELLTLGSIRFIVSKVISMLSNKYCSDILFKRDPELVYYSRDKEVSLKNKIIKNILLYILYCLPHLSDILLVLNGVGSITNCFVVKNNTDELTAKMRTKFVSPVNKKAKLDHDRNFYNSKSIVDSLIIDGASKDEIDEVLSDVKKELGSDYEDDELYSRTKNNVSNMKKLKKYSGLVSRPDKLYKDTKDNEITNIFIPDDELEKLVVHMNLMYSSGEFERSKTYRLKK